MAFIDPPPPRRAWYVNRKGADKKWNGPMHARPGQTESQVDPIFQLASTYNPIWQRLYRTLNRTSS